MNLIYKYIYFCRHYLGEDLGSLSLKELHSLEQQLETALKHVRTRKVRMHIYETPLIYIYCTRTCLIFYLIIYIALTIHILVSLFNLMALIYIYISYGYFNWSTRQNHLMYESISELQKKVASSLIKLITPILSYYIACKLSIFEIEKRLLSFSFLVKADYVF